MAYIDVAIGGCALATGVGIHVKSIGVGGAEEGGGGQEDGSELHGGGGGLMSV